MGAKSGIQKEVLALYRTLLREASKKDRMVAAAASTTATSSNGSNTEEPSFASLLFGNNDQKTSTEHVRYEFRKQASQVKRKDFRAIEYKIRHGYKQIKLLQMPGVVNFQSW